MRTEESISLQELVPVVVVIEICLQLYLRRLLACTGGGGGGGAPGAPGRSAVGDRRWQRHEAQWVDDARYMRAMV